METSWSEWNKNFFIFVICIYSQQFSWWNNSFSQIIRNQELKRGYSLMFVLWCYFHSNSPLSSRIDVSLQLLWNFITNLHNRFRQHSPKWNELLNEFIKYQSFNVESKYLGSKYIYITDSIVWSVLSSNCLQILSGYSSSAIPGTWIDKSLHVFSLCSN